ncbi:hypothetical protein DMENIID0001_154710 [Sergentomyia squamirostris]
MEPIFCIYGGVIKSRRMDITLLFCSFSLNLRFRYLFNGQVSLALDAVKSPPAENRMIRREVTPRLSERSFDGEEVSSQPRSRSSNLSPSRSRSRERSTSVPRKRPRTPSPIPAIFDNLPMLYQEQYKDPFFVDVIESLRQPHWRAPPKVQKFKKQWPDLKLHADSGALQCTVNDRDVFVIPDRIRVEIIEEFHRRQGRSGKMECRTRQDTINYVRRYCFIQGDVKLINYVINRCPHCMDTSGMKPTTQESTVTNVIRNATANSSGSPQTSSEVAPRLSKSAHRRKRRGREKARKILAMLSEIDQMTIPEIQPDTVDAVENSSASEEVKVV